MSKLGRHTMIRSALLSTILGVVVLLTPTAALAKGASKATITGPGLGGGIRLAGEGHPGGGALMRIAEDSGFFPAVFLTTPNPMLSERPDGELGPRYTIVYVMPGPSGGVDEIRQDVYPYATPSLVSYTKPGQPYFGTERTVGGWYIAESTLKDDLVAVGLRATAPRPPVADDAGREIPWEAFAVLALLVALAGLGLVVVRLRRRSDAAPA
jgi:hypothetical protein